MSNLAAKKERSPIGQAWLRRALDLAVPPPAVESYVVAGARRTELHSSRIVELYPRQYATDGAVVSHLRFALCHELVATLKAIDPTELERWVRAEPRSASSFRS